jgi:hypothetical protein
MFVDPCFIARQRQKVVELNGTHREEQLLMAQTTPMESTCIYAPAYGEVNKTYKIGPRTNIVGIGGN